MKAILPVLNCFTKKIKCYMISLIRDGWWIKVKAENESEYLRYTEDIRELTKEESRIIEDFEKHNAPSEIISEKENK